jgi:hypothetical protein
MTCGAYRVTVTGDVPGSIRSMDSNLVTALLGAFVGAIGGGVASLADTVIVNRLQLRREMRIRTYDDLLPKLAVDFVKWMPESLRLSLLRYR